MMRQLRNDDCLTEFIYSKFQYSRISLFQSSIIQFYSLNCIQNYAKLEQMSKFPLIYSIIQLIQ